MFADYRNCTLGLLNVPTRGEVGAGETGPVRERSEPTTSEPTERSRGVW
jgi:hypothetical protein